MLDRFRVLDDLRDRTAEAKTLASIVGRKPAALLLGNYLHMTFCIVIDHDRHVEISLKTVGRGRPDLLQVARFFNLIDVKRPSVSQKMKDGWLWVIQFGALHD